MNTRSVYVEAVITVVLLAALTTFLVVGDSRNLYTMNLFLIAIIGAVALNILMGTAGLVSIGNPAFMLVGAFSVVIAQKADAPILVAVPLAVVAAAVAGILVGLPAIRLRGLELALATLAGLFILVEVASNYQANNGGGTIGFLFTPLYSSKGLQGGQQWWAWTLLAVDVVVIVIAVRITGGKCGRAWRMLRDQESVAHACGIPVLRYKLMAFAITSGIIGFQGALLAYFSGSVTYEYFTFKMAVAYLAMVMIGGLDSVAGSVIGAGIVTWLPILVPKLVSSWLGSQQASRSAALSTIIYGVLVVAFVMSSSSGVVGLLRSMTGRIRRGASALSRAQPPPDVIESSAGSSAVADEPVAQ